MHTNVRLRGGKKFRLLLLAEPDLAILCKEGYLCSSVGRVRGDRITVSTANMNSLINEINYAIKKSETLEWREQLERSLILMQEIKERASEAMIVIDEYERKPSIVEKFINWLCAIWYKVIHNQ